MPEFASLGKFPSYFADFASAVAAKTSPTTRIVASAALTRPIANPLR